MLLGRLSSLSKNRPLMEHIVHTVKEHTTVYKIDNGSVYDILDWICTDTNLYPYVKQHKAKRGGKGMFYMIHSRWLGPNHINMTASKAMSVLQTSLHDREKKAWNWEKYFVKYVKYQIILGNLMEYGYQCLNLRLKV